MLRPLCNDNPTSLIGIFNLFIFELLYIWASIQTHIVSKLVYKQKTVLVSDNFFFKKI